MTMQVISKSNIAAGINQNRLLVVIAVIHWSWAWLGPRASFGDAGMTVWVVQGLILLSFALAHGVKRYGWDTMLVWGGITFFISWSIETLSIAMGGPFGNYYYTDTLGVKAGAVPLAIMPAYFVTGYLAWTMGTIFLRNLGTGIEKRNRFLVPFVASFIMVMWDLCMDPIKSTIEGAWIWEDGGAYFGVPISNYFGWYLTVFLIFQVFALYLYRYSRNEGFEQSKVYWVLAPVMYLGLALEYLLYPFWKTTNLDIYLSVFLATILTMVFASILNIIFVKSCLFYPTGGNQVPEGQDVGDDGQPARQKARFRSKGIDGEHVGACHAPDIVAHELVHEHKTKDVEAIVNRQDSSHSKATENRTDRGGSGGHLASSAAAANSAKVALPERRRPPAAHPSAVCGRSLDQSLP
jgi:uncharacterized membrane protein